MKEQAVYFEDGRWRTEWWMREQAIKMAAGRTRDEKIKKLRVSKGCERRGSYDGGRQNRI
jgi:hypothetical protein